VPVVLYGCETWSPTLREEHRLRVFLNRVLWLFEPNRADVTKERRKLHNEDVNDLNSLSNIIPVIKIRTVRLAGHVERMGGEDRCTQGFGGER
jgi:hypothetical protein